MWQESDYQFIEKEEYALRDNSKGRLFCGNVEFSAVDQGLIAFASPAFSNSVTKFVELSKKSEFISDLDQVFPDSPLSSFQSQSLAVILDELITNASWHGKMEQVEIKFYLNEKRDVLVSVHDNQGAFPLKEALKLLEVRESTQVEVRGRESRGAGVGLFFCKEFASVILFEIFTGKLTRISCVVPRRPAKTLNNEVLISYQN